MTAQDKLMLKNPIKFLGKQTYINERVVFIFGNLNGQEGRNPCTGETIHTPGKKLKEAVK